MNQTIPSRHTGSLSLGLCLAAGLIISSLICAGTFKEVKLASQTLMVKGYAEKKIVSDFAVWRASFGVADANLVAAYNKIEQDQKKVMAYLEKNGISKENYSISAVNLITQYQVTSEGAQTNQIEGYNLSQTVTVNSNNIDLIERLSRQSSELIKDNIGFTSQPAQFFYTKIDDLKIEMLGEAAKDAKARALKLAQSTGSEVGALRSAQQGVFQITPENSISVSDYGEYDVSSIRKSIKAIVTMRFEIK